MHRADADPIFQALSGLLHPYANGLHCTANEDGYYALDTPHIMRNGKPLFFGSVRIAVRYVSYHLMPVYVEPGLLAPLSGPLRRRMQGKSCFNFTRVDPALFAELGGLTRRGYEYYVAEGYVPGP